MTNIKGFGEDLIIKYSARTDVGLKRAKNEDNFIVGQSLEEDNWVVPIDHFLVEEKGSVFIVADGMGGAVAGHLASSIAIEAIRNYLIQHLKEGDNDITIRKNLDESLVYANEQILSYGGDKPEYAGMGTTATICYVKKHKVYISWIGDSRVYRYSTQTRVTTNSYNSGNLEILTDDHSVVWEEVLKGLLSPEEARTATHSNIITQSLGDPFRSVKPDHRVYDLYEGDYILNCSDGLNGMVTDAQLEQLFINYLHDANNLTEQFIEQAKNGGGTDNITVVLMQVIGGRAFLPSVVNTRNDLGEEVVEEKQIIESNPLEPVANTDKEEILQQDGVVQKTKGNLIELNAENKKVHADLIKPQERLQSINDSFNEDKTDNVIKVEEKTKDLLEVTPDEQSKSNGLIWFLFSVLVAALLAYGIINKDKILNLIDSKDHSEGSLLPKEDRPLTTDNILISNEPISLDSSSTSGEILIEQERGDTQKVNLVEKTPIKKVEKTTSKKGETKRRNKKTNNDVPKYKQTISVPPQPSVIKTTSATKRKIAPTTQKPIETQHKAIEGLSNESISEVELIEQKQNEIKEVKEFKQAPKGRSIQPELSIEEWKEKITSLEKSLGGVEKDYRQVDCKDTLRKEYNHHIQITESLIKELKQLEKRIKNDIDQLYSRTSYEFEELKTIINKCTG